MAIYWRVMSGFDNGALGFYGARDNASPILIPYVVDSLQLVWVDPWFEGLFVLSFLFAFDRYCSYEYVFQKYDDVFVIVRALVVIWPSGQCVSSTVGFSGDVTYLEVKFH